MYYIILIIIIIAYMYTHNRFHESKYKVMKCMYEDQYKYRRIMNGM